MKEYDGESDRAVSRDRYRLSIFYHFIDVIINSIQTLH